MIPLGNNLDNKLNLLPYLNDVRVCYIFKGEKTNKLIRLKPSPGHEIQATKASEKHTRSISDGQNHAFFGFQVLFYST